MGKVAPLTAGKYITSLLTMRRTGLPAQETLTFAAILFLIKSMRKFLLLVSISCSHLAQGQAPSGYYDPANDLNGQPLRIALFHIIKGHSVQSYNSLWTAFETTDKKTNGKVWDIYSDVPGGTPPYEYTFGNDQCGSYSNEGDCYNREHSWPKSYFNDQPPMNSDLFHIYPTDGEVNGKRDNDPYGVVDTTVSFWESENGSRSGTNTYPGYSGTVFEPLDSFKGDLARTYFYMSTRYYSQDGGWQNWAMANGADLKQWAADMLLQWHHMDPVSPKEIARNNAIYTLQQNRNPFIDHPEYADCIWGSATCGSPTAIAAIDASGKIRLYPNPASNLVTIDLSLTGVSGEAVLDLVTIQGQSLYHQELAVKAQAITLNLQAFSKGIYWIKISSSTAVGYKKLVIR